MQFVKWCETIEGETNIVLVYIIQNIYKPTITTDNKFSKFLVITDTLVKCKSFTDESAK